MSAPRSLAAVVGVGGLGCPAARCLVEAGVALRLLDEDRVERGNLHRQILFTDADVGEPKVHAAARALRRAVPDARLDPVALHVGPDTARALLAGVDVVLEGCDNLPAKFLVADACHALGIPVVHGACVGWIGTVLPVLPGASACYRCVFEDLPDAPPGDCATAGVYGPVTAVVGALMAADALGLLRGDRARAGSIARYDGWRQSFRSTTLRPRPACALCGPGVAAPDLDPARYAWRCS